jgi:hypothetical protein
MMTVTGVHLTWNLFSLSRLQVMIYLEILLLHLRAVVVVVVVVVVDSMVGCYFRADYEHGMHHVPPLLTVLVDIHVPV